MMQDENGVFSSNLQALGYSFSISQNIFSVLCLALAIALTWFVMAILVKFFRKGASSQTNSKTTEEPHTSSEVFMNNFMVRFIYAVYFELMLCAFINITSQSGSSLFWWIFSLMTIVAGIGSLFTLLSFFLCNGPYMVGTYEAGSLLKSFWGVRSLDSDFIKCYQQAQENKTQDRPVHIPHHSMPIRQKSNDEMINLGSFASQTQSMFHSNIPLHG